MGKPVIEMGNTLRVFAAAGEKADAMLRHGILVGGLVAEINAPTHSLGKVGSGHVNAAVIEENSAASPEGNADGFPFGIGQMLLIQLGESCARIGFGMPGQKLRAMGSRPDVQATVHRRGIHKRYPHRYDRIGL